MYTTSKRFPDVETTSMMTPGPGAFAEEKKDKNNTFLKSKQTIEERRRESSFLHPKQTRKPTFGASSRNDRSPWSYLTNASHQGRSTPGPMRYNPRLVAVTTKAGPNGTFDDQMYKDFKDYKTYITDRQHSVVVKNFEDQTYSIKKLKDRFKRGRIAGDVDRQLLDDYQRKGDKFKEYKVKKRPQSAAKAERFSDKATVIKDPGSYLGPSDPATGAFGNAVKTAIRINDERTLELMRVRGELDKLKKNTKAYAGSKRSSTFGTSKRFVRKFASRSGSNTLVGDSRSLKSKRKRLGKGKILQSKSDNKSSNSSIVGTIEVMKREAKLMEEKNPLSEIFLRSKRNIVDDKNLSSNMRERKKRQEKYEMYKLRLHSREYMMHKSVSQPNFCSPGFGTSKRFTSDKGTERSFHESMPGPGYYAKVITGNREETKASTVANGMPLPATLKSSTLKGLQNCTKEDIERQVEREQDLLRKRPGTFGKDRREPLSKLLNKWGAGIDVEGTPGPGDYSYMEKDTFGDQIKTMNARCQLQEELKSQLMEGDIIEKNTSKSKARNSRRDHRSQKLRPRSALQRYIKKESSRRPKTAGRLSNTYKMSYNDRNGSNKYSAKSRSLSASSKSQRKEYHSPSYSMKAKHKAKKSRPWTAGDERRLIGKPPNLDQEMASSMKRQKRPSSVTLKKNQSGTKSNGAFNWKGKFEGKSLSLYTKNDIVQFQSGLYMLVKEAATGDPAQPSSGWVEYLKIMTKKK